MWALTAEFFTKRMFGPDRAAMLAAQLPATAADEQHRRDRKLGDAGPGRVCPAGMGFRLGCAACLGGG